MQSRASEAASRFTKPRDEFELSSLGSGNVNDTFLVRESSGQEFVLQRLNRHVFPNPELIMKNLRVFSEHLAGKDAGGGWKFPVVLTTTEGDDFWEDYDGGFWRAISYIEGAYSVEKLDTVDQAEAVAAALGAFHRILSDLPVDKLEDTLVGFHIAPEYLSRFDQVMKTASVEKSSEFDFAESFINERRQFLSILETAKANGVLKERVIHGDPKAANVLFDLKSNKAVSFIDLDTLKPGLLHYDIGDCIRSCCNVSGEDLRDWESAAFSSEYCERMLGVYLKEASGILCAEDYDYIYDAIRLLPLELGLRFLTDYLEGDVYFKTEYPEHNLYRALVQFKITEQIEGHESAIRELVNENRK